MLSAHAWPLANRGWVDWQLGDSDCYHNPRHANSTRTVIAIADKFKEEEMPGAWFLVNDGYSCGYGEGPFLFPNGTKTFPHDFEDLDFVVAELNARGFVAGLWSSTGLPNIKREVCNPSRLIKCLGSLFTI